MTMATSYYLSLIWTLLFVCEISSYCPPTYISTDDIQNALHASSFAYEPESIKGNKVPDTNFKIIAHVESEIAVGHTPVKAFVAEDQDTTLIVFRGTITSHQLLDEVVAVILHLGGHKVTIDGSQATIVKYFWLGYKLLYDTIRPYLDRVGQKYIITGHSLGGAMASIMAVMAIENKHGVWDNDMSSLITFGQPRTGDGVYAAKHDKMISTFRKLRFTNRNDPLPQLLIPMVPHLIHHSREIWMATQVKLWFPKAYWKVCDERDTKWCSGTRFLFPNLLDHKIIDYAKYIFTLPPLYYDERNRERQSLKGALTATCQTT